MGENPRETHKINIATLIKNYREIVAEIPGYILRAAKGQRRETLGPKGIVEKLYTSGYRLDDEAGWVRTDKGKRKIAE